MAANKLFAAICNRQRDQKGSPQITHNKTLSASIGRNKADTLMRCSGNTPAPTLLLAKLPEGMIRAIDPSSASMELAAISEEKFESIFIARVSAKKFLTTAH